MQQAALQVTGNNIANAGNADYTRQTAPITHPDQQIGPGCSSAPASTSDRRPAAGGRRPNSRLRGSRATTPRRHQPAMAPALKQHQRAGRPRPLAADEHILQQLVGLANKPQEIGLRQVVLQNGRTPRASRIWRPAGRMQGDVDEHMKAQPGRPTHWLTGRRAEWADRHAEGGRAGPTGCATSATRTSSNSRSSRTSRRCRRQKRTSQRVHRLRAAGAQRRPIGLTDQSNHRRGAPLGCRAWPSSTTRGHDPPVGPARWADPVSSTTSTSTVGRLDDLAGA